MEFPKRILVLAPHPDDGEFGAGASLHKWSAEGREVFYRAFSPCHISIPEGFPQDVLSKELSLATERLGIPAEHVEMLSFPVRHFLAHRQEILEQMILFRKELAPDLVILPSSTDIHQDHTVIHEEGVRAFKHSCILGYELPWNQLTTHTDFHVQIDEPDIDAKWQALAEYRSQAKRFYADREFITGLARVRGQQIGVKRAEAFECVRWISR